METKQILSEFKKYEESKDYNFKYKEGLEFLKKNKNKDLLEFDKNFSEEKSNPQLIREMIDKFNLKEEDLSFFVLFVTRN